MPFFPGQKDRLSDPASSPASRRRPAILAALLVLATLGIGAVLFLQGRPPSQPELAGPPPPRIEACPPWASDLCEPDGNLFARTEEDPAREVLAGSIKPGQTLAGILGGYLDADRLGALEDPEDFSFNKIQSGQPYRLTLRDRELVAFEYDISPTEKLVIDETDGELAARGETRPIETRQEVMAGIVESSLFAAVTDAGGNADTAVALADVFAYDIDFCQDVQKGDAFRAVVERQYADGKAVGFGRVLAAEFVNQGKAHRGFALFRDTGRVEYLDPDGRPLRKAFLRAPLSFLRISSGYTASRLHPILKVRKAHYGVDYAAPAGTPVWSVGDGVVIERGRNHAAGNYVTVRHGATYVTRYNHLSRFAKGLAQGTRVAQGEVIGYVGSTGYATGPHLDFRIYRNGAPINALANQDIMADPLPRARLAAFQREAARLAALMEGKNPEKSLAESRPGTSGRFQ